MTEHKDLADGLRSKLDELERRFHDLRDRVEETAEDVKGRMRPFLDEIERAAKATRATTERLATMAGEHGRDLAKEAGAEIEGLEHEVSAAAHELREELADDEAAFSDAAAQELSSWRACLDHMTVQADLGRMEMRDEIDHLRKRAEHAFSTARARLDDMAGHGDTTLDTIREGAEHVMVDVRTTVRQLMGRSRAA